MFYDLIHLEYFILHESLMQLTLSFIPEIERLLQTIESDDVSGAVHFIDLMCCLIAKYSLTQAWISH